MMQHQIDLRFHKLESFIQQSFAHDLSEEVQSYLSRFGAVLICGNVERSCEIIILHRLEKRAHPRVLNFVKSHFKRGMNLDCTAIEQLLARFDPGWQKNFKAFIDSNSAVEEGISSCYAVRNSVAHGGQMSVGKKRLRELFDLSKKLVDGIIEATA
ncbi:HEPN domain-containing protein [Marinimicrococcus flavescens]|uniref:HEPN domain-containing protein n=1 Tax=Marinimicrococcus flavescens TaxID=3031815 RepID=A0AAP3UXL2_9PROT|nr:HEPN domain-containing protein [Marinimicrococcus flavescens]